MKQIVKKIGYGFAGLAMLIALAYGLQPESSVSAATSQAGTNDILSCYRGGPTEASVNICPLVHVGQGHQAVKSSFRLFGGDSVSTFGALNGGQKAAVFAKPSQVDNAFFGAIGPAGSNSWIGGTLFVGLSRKDFGNTDGGPQGGPQGTISYNWDSNNDVGPFGTPLHTVLQKVNVNGNILSALLEHDTSIDDQVCVDAEGTLVLCGNTASCTGATPANSVMCQYDNENLTASTAKTLVATCSSPAGSAPKCEYTCANGYHLDNGSCVADSYHWVTGDWSPCSGEGTGTCSGSWETTGSGSCGGGTYTDGGYCSGEDISIHCLNPNGVGITNPLSQCNLYFSTNPDNCESQDYNNHGHCIFDPSGEDVPMCADIESETACNNSVNNNYGDYGCDGWVANTYQCSSLSTQSDCQSHSECSWLPGGTITHQCSDKTGTDQATCENYNSACSWTAGSTPVKTRDVWCEESSHPGVHVNSMYCDAATKPATTMPCDDFSCTGTTPANASLCVNDASGLIADTPKTLVATCSSPAGSAPKCEYTCNSGYTQLNGECIQIYTQDDCNDGNGGCQQGKTCCRVSSEHAIYGCVDTQGQGCTQATGGVAQ